MQKMLRSVKNHACAWLCALFLILPVLKMIGAWCGRELVLYMPVLMHGVIALLTAVLSVSVLHGIAFEKRSERVGALIAPAAAMIYAFSLMVGLKEWSVALCGLVGCIAALVAFVGHHSDGERRRVGWGVVYGMGVLIVSSFAGLIGAAVMLGIGCILLIMLKVDRFRAALGAVYGAAGTFTVLILLAGILFAATDFGAEYSSEALDSPDGRYTARLVFVDEGALGSSQYVLVEEKGAGINVLIGRLQKSKRIFLDELNYVYDWDNESFVPFEWADEHTLTVDGRRVEVN